MKKKKKLKEREILSLRREERKGAISGSHINEEYEKQYRKRFEKEWLEYAFCFLKHYEIVPQDTKLVIRKINE